MTEAEFSRGLVKVWRQKHCFVQRIETGTIARGVPDIYVGTKKGNAWVELKSVRFKPFDGMTIPWRPGQQGWMLEHFKVTNTPCFTVIKFNNCIGVIKMTKRFVKNKVMLCDVVFYESLQDVDI